MIQTLQLKWELYLYIYMRPSGGVCASVVDIILPLLSYILLFFSHVTVMSLDVLYGARSGLYRDIKWLDISPWQHPLLGL